MWLSGGTDDNFINYYNLNYSLPEVLVGCGASDQETNTSTEFRGATLYVNLTVKKLEAREPDINDLCTANPSPAQGRIDIDKEWLAASSLKILFNDIEKEITIDHNERLWFMDETNKMPFYPDGVAVLKCRPRVAPPILHQKMGADLLL